MRALAIICILVLAGCAAPKQLAPPAIKHRVRAVWVETPVAVVVPEPTVSGYLWWVNDTAGLSGFVVERASDPSGEFVKIGFVPVEDKWQEAPGDSTYKFTLTNQPFGSAFYRIGEVK